MNPNIKKVLSTLSPKLTTYLMYYYNFKKLLNLKNPSTINEKLQYLKLHTYYNNPVVTQCVDKYRVREYLTDHGYEHLLPELIAGGIEDPEEIRQRWETFPDSFVIKCNHGCGYNILVKNKAEENVDQIVAQLTQWMKENYWKYYCEPQYKQVKKCILVEQYLADDIQTYKFYCFHGKPQVAYVSENGPNGEKDLYLDYYDMKWHRLPLTLDGHLHKADSMPAPENLQEMVRTSCELSKDFPFVRIDLYDVNGKVYFSEFTFIPTGGMMQIHPPEVLDEWGKMINLGGVFPKNT